MKHDTIIISIHPAFVDKILTGEKCYEYRKYFPVGVRQMLIYATSPVKKVTAVVDVDFVLCDTPLNIWRKTENYSGITKEFFDAYFKDRNIAYAIKLKNILKLNRPRMLTEWEFIKAAPQSFIYLN